MDSFNVLVVDDQLNWRQVMSALLSDVGYEVKTAASVDSAWALLESGVFDIAIIDVRLVDKNPYDVQGIELLEQMRLQLRENLPVVVMTGYSFEGMEDLLREKYGVQCFIKKGSGVFQDIKAFRSFISSIIESRIA